MVNNIKIIGNITSVSTVSRYDIEDTNLIPSENIQTYFGNEGDYIEYYIYDIGGNLLDTNYNYLNYKLPSSNNLIPGVKNDINTNNQINSSSFTPVLNDTGSLYPVIEIDPIKDIQNRGYSSGEFKVTYNIFNRTLSNIQDKALFIKEISQDRTEIRLASVSLTNDEIEDIVNKIITKINNSTYNIDYLLNFGNNQQFLTTNIALNKVDTGYEILFKLYKDLPLNIVEKQTLCVVEEKVNPYIFDVNLDKLISKPESLRLKGPNFNISIPDTGNTSTTYTDYSTALVSLQTLQSSSYNHINNILNNKSININIDYTDFNNFIFFSSIYQRVVNFYNKVKQIEDYNILINYYTPYISTTSSLQLEINQYSSSINNIITQFDGYEKYLYFESSSYTWPKSGSIKPYSLLSTGSATVNTWYNNLTGSALIFDESNYDNLVYSIPDFIRDDEKNAPFLLFLNMIGHHFDDTWVYIKSITDVNLANNNLNKGISKDLVYDKLKSLGIKLYNSQAGEDLDKYLIGANTGSNIWDNDFSITGSYLNNIPRKDLLSELYKRIYHNLPLLLKTKGTKLGLEYLISTFGIPNKTYYRIGDNTFYTITGSNSTSSILNIKEYGGSTKYNLLKGYNSEKVRIVENEITGIVLSPLISLQTFPTESNLFRENDSNYIDISFSPEDEINTYISSSISSNNPTWILDNYIGDPRQLYSASYSDLTAQRKLYFETGISGYPGFTGSLLDYNGFIRLIQYFDNALFKMLEDFVPERTSLSTGITIESPILERNKVVYSIPKIEKQQTYTAEYSSPTINKIYDKIYYSMPNDRKAYYDGNITGSLINVNKYFISGNLNPYLKNWDVYNNQNNISESINLDKFLHSEYNVLLNNVSQSITSNTRKKIEYIYGTTGSLTSSVELQDSYLNLNSHINSRYKGIKLTSLNYNTYTSSSYTSSYNIIQNGDISYGKTAVIDRNSYKLGWIQSIPTQSLNFYYKTPISLRYLIDTKNEVTDLNSYNNNWFEIQNIFKSHNPAVLSITDKNQKRRDGEKLIWKGGYRFDPILYRENGDTLTFRYENYYATSSIPLGFLSSDLNKYEFEANTAGTIDQNPADIISNSDNVNYFYINNVTSLTTPNGNNQVSPEVLSFSSWGHNSIRSLSNITSNLEYIVDNRTTDGPIYRFDIFNFNNFTTPNLYAALLSFFSLNTTVAAFNTEPILSNVNNNIYKVTRQSPNGYKIIGGTNVKVRIKGDNNNGSQVMFKMALLVETANQEQYESNQWQIQTPIIASASLLDRTSPDKAPFDQGDTNSIRLNSTNPQDSVFIDLLYILNSNTIYIPPVGSYLRLSFYFLDIQRAYAYTNNVNIQFKDTYWGIVDATQKVTQYLYDSTYTSSSIFSLGTSNTSNDTLIFTSSLSPYFYSASFSGSNSSYSSVIDNMSIQRGDLIKFGRFTDPGEYYEVSEVRTGGSPVSYSAVLNTSLPTIYNISSNFAILRPKPDETSVILEGRNIIGTQNIESALLVPYDASNTLNNNIGTIVKSLNNII